MQAKRAVLIALAAAALIGVSAALAALIVLRLQPAWGGRSDDPPTRQRRLALPDVHVTRSLLATIHRHG